MILLTKELKARLIANGIKQAPLRGTPQEIDFKPVVKLFTPDAGATWLLCEILDDNHDLAFGLCDLGLGFPELGLVSLMELAEVRGNIGLPVERDRNFEADRTLLEYCRIANEAGRIIA